MRIRTKILLIGLIIPLGVLLTLTAVSWYYLRNLALNAVTASTHVSVDAAKTSEDALLKFTDFFITTTARFRANLCEQQLLRASDGAQLLVEVVKDYYDATKQTIAEPSADDLAYAKKELNIYQLPDAKNTTEDRNVFYQLSEILVGIRDLPLNCNAYIASLSGVIHAAHTENNGFPQGYDFRQREWFKAAVKNEKAGWSDVYHSINNGEEIITYYAPVYRSLDGKNILTAVVGVDVLLADLAKSLTDAPLSDEGYLTLLKNNGEEILRLYNQFTGKKITHSEGAEKNWTRQPQLSLIVDEIKKGHSGAHNVKINDQKYSIAYAPIKLVDWGLCVVVPIDAILRVPQEIAQRIEQSGAVVSADFERQLTRSFFHYYLAVGVAMILMIIFSTRISRRIVRALQTLSDGTKKISHGDFSTKINVNTNDELQTLSTDFNAMATRLYEYTTRLLTAERMESEMRTAGEIQRQMLPQIFPPFPERQEFSLYAYMEPAREIGGDFYDFFLVENKVCIVIGDVSGKGVPAALFMAMGKKLLKILISQHRDIATALTVFNQMLVDDHANYFMTLFVGLIDYQTGVMEYVDAGHNPPLYCADQLSNYHPFTNRTTKNPAIGMTDDWVYRRYQLTLAKGSRLFIYTDGVSEAENTQLKLFGEKALIATLNDNNDLPIESVINHLQQQLRFFAGDQPASDDVTMLIFAYHGNIK